MTVSSPDTLDGVEGLTHDHVVGIGDGNYMHFQHAYAVTKKVDDTGMELFNPHGTSAGNNRQIYNPDLKDMAINLEKTINTLLEEFTLSQDKSFSNSTKEKLDANFELFYLEDNKENVMQGYNNPILKKLYRVWKKVSTQAKQNGDIWEIDKKNIKRIQTYLPVYKEEFAKSMFRNGFGSETQPKINSNQLINYNVLARFFSQLSLFKIND